MPTSFSDPWPKTERRFPELRQSLFVALACPSHAGPGAERRGKTDEENAYRPMDHRCRREDRREGGDRLVHGAEQCRLYLLEDETP